MRTYEEESKKPIATAIALLRKEIRELNEKIYKTRLEGFVPEGEIMKMIHPEFIVRIQEEQKELRERYIKLRDFMRSKKYSDLSTAEKLLLEKQLEHMDDYERILIIRLAIYGIKIDEE